MGVWKRITKNILNDNNSDLFAQENLRGDYDLRLTISRYLRYSSGGELPPGIDHCRSRKRLSAVAIGEKILGGHVGIAMENPTSKRAYRIFESFAYRIHTVDMDDKGNAGGQTFGTACQSGLCDAFPPVSPPVRS